MDRLLRKWNGNKKEYEDYKIPGNWNVKTYCADMDEIVNCAQCGKELKYGNTYTSMEVHTEMGFGYGVCDTCYRFELKRRFKEDDE